MEVMNLNHNGEQPSIERTFNKKELSRALAFQKVDCKFSNGEQLDTSDLGIDAIQFEKHRIIQLPVCYEAFKQLEVTLGHGFERAPEILTNLAPTRSLEPLKVLSANNTLLRQAIFSSLGIPIDISTHLDLKLDKIVIQSKSNGSHFMGASCEEVDDINKGLIAKAVLQLPVEGGHKGGRLKVMHKKSVVTYDNSDHSDQSSYLTVCYSDCNFSIEPLSAGSQVMFIYSLVWINAAKTLPQNFAAFVDSYNKVKNALFEWIPSQEIGNGINEDLNSVKQLILNSIQYAACSNYSEEMSVKSELNDSLLCFELEEDYAIPQELAFPRLRGRDRDRVAVFENCSFVDIHLLVRTYDAQYPLRKRTECNECGLYNSSDCRWCRENPNRIGPLTRRMTLKNHGWINIHEENIYFDSGIEMHFQEIELFDRIKRHYRETELDNRNPRQWRQRKSDPTLVVKKTKKPDGTWKVVSHYTHNDSVLVIWPKSQTYRIYMCYGVQLLVNRWEDSLRKPSQNSSEQLKQEITTEIGKLISLLSDTELRDWSRKLIDSGSLLYRLFRLCITLKAKREGILLLSLLQFDSNDPNKVNFVDVASEAFVEAIAEFESRVSGWLACARVVQNLFLSEHTSQHYLLMIHFAKCFLNVNCVDGANWIANLISPNFHALSEFQDNHLEEKFEPVINFVRLLEEDPRTSNATRVNTFIDSYFAHFSPTRMVQLLTTARWEWFNLGVLSCKLLFEKMALTLLNCDLLEEATSAAAIIKIMEFFARHQRYPWLNLFLSRLCQRPTTSDPTLYYSLIDKLIVSDEIMNLVATCQAVNLAFCPLVSQRVSLLARQLATVDFSAQNNVVDLLSSYLKFVKCLIQKFLLAENSIFPAITSSLAPLDINHLTRFAMEVYEFRIPNTSGHNDTKQSVDYLKLIFKALINFISQKPSSALPLELLTPNTLECLALLGLPYVVSFLRSAVPAKVLCPWHYVSKCQFFTFVLSDIFPRFRNVPTHLEIIKVCMGFLKTFVLEVDLSSRVNVNLSLYPLSEFLKFIEVLEVTCLCIMTDITDHALNNATVGTSQQNASTLTDLLEALKTTKAKLLSYNFFKQSYLDGNLPTNERDTNLMPKRPKYE